MNAPLPVTVMRFAVPALAREPHARHPGTGPGVGALRPNAANDTSAEPDASAAPPERPRTPAWEPPLVLPRALALDLLEWLGLGRPEFGALRGRELAPLCRRRLWPIPRNLDAAHGDRPRGALRARTAQLLGIAEQAGERLVMFG